MFLFMKNKEIIQIRLLVIEDNAALVKAGLRNFFRTGRDKIHVSHITENVEQAINEINVLDFDVILLDLFIPGTSPVHNMGLLKQKFPGKPVVIYSSMNSKIWRRRMWDLGANGYVHKNDDRDTLKTAIEDAFEGKVVFSPSEGQSNLIHRGLRTIPETLGCTAISGKFCPFGIKNSVNLKIYTTIKSDLNTFLNCYNNTWVYID